MKLLSRLMVLSVLFLGTGVSPTDMSDAPESVKKMLFSEHPRIQELHQVATRWRMQSGMAPQVLDEELCIMAQRWANNMAARNSMYHGGGEQVVAYGYANAESCIQGWVNSPGHRMWVLGGNQRCGFGCQRGSNGQLYWAGVFR